MRAWYCFFLLFLFFFGCAHPPSPNFFSVPESPSLHPYSVNGHTYYPLPFSHGYVEEGIASWYGPGFHGRKTSSGEKYNMYAFTAAHKLLPLGTYVLVTNLENGKKVVVKINDRGPFVKNRIIDLSYAAAKRLGLLKKGTARVRIVALAEGKKQGDQIIYQTRHPLWKGRFFLQIGSFLDYAKAVELKRKLNKRFRFVRIESFKKGSLCFFRVQAYIADNLQMAQKIYTQLKKEYPQSFLVAK